MGWDACRRCIDSDRRAFSLAEKGTIQMLVVFRLVNILHEKLRMSFGSQLHTRHVFYSIPFAFFLGPFSPPLLMRVTQTKQGNQGSSAWAGSPRPETSKGAVDTEPVVG